MANDGREKKKRKQGGFRTMPFILVFDRFAAAGFNANMVSYLTTELHMPLVEATNTLNKFGGTSAPTPIIDALAADSFAGRFWTITVGSIIYQLGMMSLTISAILPAARPPECSLSGTCQRATEWQLSILYASLLLTAIGSGGIHPCAVAFGADQFDLNQQPRKKPQKWNFFNLYFFSMGLAVLLALTVVVYIQDNVGWGWGFGIPAIGIFLSVAALVVGYPLYIMHKPGGTPLTRLAQVVVAAIRKRKVAMPDDPSLLYVDQELDADISTAGRLLPTNNFKFLDQAAIVTEGDMTESHQPRLWRLSTVHRVEELKSIIRMVPIWSVGILLVTAASHNYTFAIMQAKTMDRHITHKLQIPAATVSIFSVVSMLVSLGLYDRVFVPMVRRFTGRPSGITYLQRMGIGLAISILANVSAALVETRRKAAAAESGLLGRPDAAVPYSIFWLVPQYVISGLADAFSSVGLMEFMYDQSPESMRSTATALFWLATSVGSYMGTLLVTMVNDSTKGEWLQDNINEGKLNYYYWLVTGLQVLNLGYYMLCAKLYTSKPLEVVGDEIISSKVEDGGHSSDLEIASQHVG